jgi:soluble lytic murein transglycosylase
LQYLSLKSRPIRPGSPHASLLRRLPVLAVACLFLSLSISAVDARRDAAAQLSGSVDPLSYKYPAALQATLAALGKGVGEYAGGRFASALAALPADTAAASNAISDYILLYRAKANLELAKGKEALELFRTIQDRYPGSPLLLQAVQGSARSLLILHDPMAALALLDRVQIKDDAEVLCLRGWAAEEGGRNADAVRLYMRVYADFVDSDSSAYAEGRLRMLSPAFLTKAENRDFVLRRCENLIRAARSQEARTLLLRLEGALLPGLRTEELYLLLADADTNLTRWTEALQYLRRVADPAFAAQANYLKGICYRGLGNETSLLEIRDRALQLHPQSPFTEKLLYSIATYYDIGDRAESARTAYQAQAHAFPKGEFTERSLWRSAWFLYMEGRYEEALSGFWQSLLTNPTPSTAGAPAFWMGRCYERLGHPDKAASLYRRIQTLANNSYYGLRAREALEALKSDSRISDGVPGAVDFVQVSQKLDAIRPKSAQIPQPSPGILRAIERARLLVAAGVPDLALAELEHPMAGIGADDKILCYAVARVFLGKSDFLNAILTLRRTFPDYNILPPSYLPEEVWSLFFPVRYLNLVNKHAARYQLDPNLILAVIRQESAFNESARSRANARGLMQVLPTTGRLLARQAGIGSYTIAKLYEPEANIALGTTYLAERLRRYGGRIELALAAYNAGDNRVDRWLQEFGNVDMVEFVERIPFSETRSYVKQVLSNRTHYKLHTAQNSGPALSAGRYF